MRERQHLPRPAPTDRGLRPGGGRPGARAQLATPPGRLRVLPPIHRQLRGKPPSDTIGYDRKAPPFLRFFVSSEVSFRELEIGRRDLQERVSQRMCTPHELDISHLILAPCMSLCLTPVTWSL